MATMFPESGSTDTIEEPTESGLSSAGCVASTCSWATDWAFGSRVVTIFSPPRWRLFRRSSGVSPNSGEVRISFSTYVQK